MLVCAILAPRSDIPGAELASALACCMAFVDAMTALHKALDTSTAEKVHTHDIIHMSARQHVFAGLIMVILVVEAAL